MAELQTRPKAAIDVDEKVLQRLIDGSVNRMRKAYKTK